MTHNGVEIKAPIRKPAKIGMAAFSSKPNKLSTTYGTEAVIDCTNVRYKVYDTIKAIKLFCFKAVPKDLKNGGPFSIESYVSK
ncbi:hypothetical protein ES705_11027 [subsurface metagenome]